MTLSCTDIQIRDPFILPVQEEERYYLYGTTDRHYWDAPATGFDCFIGRDLKSWTGPFPVFRPPPDFWADRNFWAPEVYPYLGSYFMFATFTAPGLRRGTQVLVADSPRGPFFPHSPGPVTPSDWMCLDGTLFLDYDACPWMVFCHEWLQVVDGQICAIRLSSDLSKAAGDPMLLFRASEAPWAVPADNKGSYVTDGPFLYRAKNDELWMLWSSFSPKGYALGLAKSASGHVRGPWDHDAEPLFEEDGGHGMLFRTFAGELMLAVHAPNARLRERPVFLKVGERRGRLRLAPA